MNYVIFLIGFLLGAVLALILQVVVAKRANNAEIALQKREEELYRRMQTEFENTALKIFNNSSDSITNKNSECLDRFLRQFKERIEDFEKHNNENARLERDKLITFDNNIQNFIKAGNQISQDAASLVKVMKADNRTSGRWGELVLERVFESSGLRRGEEYDLQAVVTEGRPDAVVYLPENKKVFVDAKTSFASWDNYLNAQSDEERAIYLKEFKHSLKTHIDGLAKREYVDDTSFQYIMMFIPIESCYSLIFCDDCELWDYSWKKRIMPVSPSTLLASLKIVNSVMAIDRQNKNAQEIVKVCTGMLDKFAALLSDLKKTRDGLNSALVKLEGRGNMIGQIEKLEALGVKSSKEIQLLEVEETI